MRGNGIFVDFSAFGIICGLVLACCYSLVVRSRLSRVPRLIFLVLIYIWVGRWLCGAFRVPCLVRAMH